MDCFNKRKKRRIVVVRNAVDCFLILRRRCCCCVNLKGRVDYKNGWRQISLGSYSAFRHTSFKNRFASARRCSSGPEIGFPAAGSSHSRNNSFAVEARWRGPSHTRVEGGGNIVKLRSRLLYCYCFPYWTMANCEGRASRLQRKRQHF